MKTQFTHPIVLSQGPLDPHRWAEVLWNVPQATVTVRITRAGGTFLRWLTTERIRPFGTFGELRHELNKRFDALAVHDLFRRRVVAAAGCVPCHCAKAPIRCPKNKTSIWRRVAELCGTLL